MADRDYAPLSAACVRALIDKQYDKRKIAAAEIEKMVKEFVSNGNTVQIKKLLKVLGQEFTLSPNLNYCKGGLIGLASMAVALGKDSPEYTEALIRPILTHFSDNDLRMRYYACEALYNVVKVARGAVLPYFTEIFAGLSKLAADPDQSVKNGSELLDRLMKDIVTESATFDLISFMPLLRERIYSPNPFARQFIISWISVLDAVPDIHLIQFLPEILDGLFHMLGDADADIKKMCDTVLNEFMRSIKKDPSQVDFNAMINIIIVHAQASDELLQHVAILWIKEFIELSGKEMLPFTSGILMAVLPCFAYEGDSKSSIKETAKLVNSKMMELITQEEFLHISEFSNSDDQSSLDLSSILDALSKQLLHVSVPTKVAALVWIYHLYENIPNRMLKFVDTMSPRLLRVLSDHSDEVVQQVLHVIALIISPGTKDSSQSIQPSPYFSNFLVSLLKLFKVDSQLLEERGSFIIRQLCILLNAEDIYQNTANILKNEKDIKFAGLMVDTLNDILLTSSEMFDLRNKLKNDEWNQLFECLYETWCHNPVATISLCLLTQNYAHTCDLIFILSNYEVTVEILAEIDRLIQLLESPIFVQLRLQLLEPEYNSSLVKAMYGLLMMLPQSEAFHTLRHRLACIPTIHFKDLNIGGDDTNCDSSQIKPSSHSEFKNKYLLDFDKLKKHFISVQEIHRQKKLTARREAIISKT